MIWHQLSVKCVLVVTMPEVELKCCIDQLCGDLDVDIESRVYSMCTIWELLKGEKNDVSPHQCKKCT